MSNLLEIIKGRQRVKTTKEIIYPETSDDQVVIEGTKKTLRNALIKYLVDYKEPTEEDKIGYNIYSNGYVEIWGEYGSWTGNPNISILLPISLKNTYYNVNVILLGSVDRTNNDLSLSARNKDSFSIKTYSCVTTGFLWSVKGYINVYEYYYGFARPGCSYKAYSRRTTYYAWKDNSDNFVYTYVSNNIDNPKIYQYISNDMVIEDITTTHNTYSIQNGFLYQTNSETGTVNLFNRAQTSDIELQPKSYYIDANSTGEGEFPILTMEQIQNLEESTDNGTITNEILYVGDDGQEYLRDESEDYLEISTKYFLVNEEESHTFPIDSQNDLYEKQENEAPKKIGNITMTNTNKFIWNNLTYIRNSDYDFTYKKEQFR